MDDIACTGDSCSASPDATPRPNDSGREALDIEVVSDVVCPWCFIGKRRLEKSLSLLAADVRVRVTWRPFQLNPGMPRQGMDRRSYRIAKFGTWERSLALDAQVAAAGAEEGIRFEFDRMVRTPNTLDAHRLIWLAQRHGVQDSVVEALFRGYFTDGLDVGDASTLEGIAVAGGIPASAVAGFFAGEQGRDEVLREEARCKDLGIGGVPAFLVDGRLAFSGAVDPHRLVEAFRQASEPIP
jgi:predicted DsbA family dithiol-disulfide isomerase